MGKTKVQRKVEAFQQAMEYLSQGYPKPKAKTKRANDAAS